MTRIPIRGLLALMLFAVLPCLSQAKDKADRRLLMWIDGEANFRRFSNTDSIDFYVARCARLGFTDLVVDVRPITGEVFFHTPYAPMMTEWQGYKRPDFDYLGHFITEAHKHGMRVQASMNCFVAGHNFFDRGIIYSSHPEWASVVYSPTKGLVPITEEKEKYSAMVDPMNRNFRKQYSLLLKDLVRQYPQLDGVLLDRVRYDGIEADFSDNSRQLFEQYLGRRLRRFPEDIYEWKKGADGKYQVSPGRYYKEWILWRAQNIYQAMKEWRDAVKSVRRSCEFGTYTGAWYPSYYEVGVNFASNTYDPSKEPEYHEWVTPEYKETGYMELLDVYTTGNYYTDVTVKERRANNQSVWNETDSRPQTGDWYCVEGSCQKLRAILGGHQFYGGVLVDQFYDHPEKLAASISMNLKESDGLMLFDICHLIAHPELWKEVERGIKAH